MKKLNPSENRNQLKERIAPGIWIDMNDNVHWSITELLQLVDLENTEENREIVTRILQDLIRKAAPTATIVYRDGPND